MNLIENVVDRNKLDHMIFSAFSAYIIAVAHFAQRALQVATLPFPLCLPSGFYIICEKASKMFAGADGECLQGIHPFLSYGF